LIGVLYLIGLLLSQFIMELSIINSQSIAAGFLADFLRYSLVLLMLLMVTSNVAEDFEYRQIERILTMPISRWQYIAAQFLVAMLTALVLVLPGLIVFGFYASFETAAYWTVALWLEVLLVGLIGLLTILSLEKVPVAVFVSLSVYLLSKLSGLISRMLQESVYLSDGALSSRFAETVFSGILYILPGLESFAESDVYFEQLALTPLLITQLLSVSVYVLLILSVCLVDFYRKEINF
jgi:ABC-type transport system involved in multi-copper enzyme maturation permease subunit